MEYITLSIALIAITISIITFWLTKIRKGIVKMTRPTVIFFGPDGGGKGDNKIFIRTLLYSTSDKGLYIQNMFIRLQRGESIQNFNVWVYDDNGLVRGSGLFVNKSGIASNHHFLLPKDGTNYNFLAGEYSLQVFIETVDKSPTKIFEQKLSISKSQEQEMLNQKAGTYFDWAPNNQNYLSHIDYRKKENKEFTELIDKLTGIEK